LTNNDEQRELLIRTVTAGALSGMRSMSGPAAIANWASLHPQNYKKTLFSRLADKKVARAVSMMLYGEMMLDKLPILPNRNALLPLLGRMGWGGLAGAAAFAGGKRPIIQGAALSAFAAFISTQITFQMRVGLPKLLRLPDQFVALMEDALVLAVVRRVIAS